MMISFVSYVQHLVGGVLYRVTTLHWTFVCPSHRLRLRIFPVITIDVMKSEERQKLAKERREEKAKYFGKYSRSKAWGHVALEESSPMCWDGSRWCFC